MRLHLFLPRVVGAWNALPGMVVEADTIERGMKMQEMEGYGSTAGLKDKFNFASYSTWAW